MLTYTVRIAELSVCFETVSPEISDYLLEKFAGDGSEGAAGPVEDPDLALTVAGGYGEPFVDFEVSAAKEDDGRIVFTRADYRITVEPGHRSALIEVYDLFALKHAMIHIYSMVISHREWGLLIHSSCLLQGDRAYLFAGHSGAGKSTVVQLSRPRPILSDEASIVKIAADGITIFNSPFRSDTDRPDIRDTYPLSGIHMLRQALYNERSRMSGISGLTELLNRVFYWAYDPEETKKVLRLCKRLVDRVPVYDLYFQKNHTFWEEIS